MELSSLNFTAHTAPTQEIMGIEPVSIVDRVANWKSVLAAMLAKA